MLGKGIVGRHHQHKALAAMRQKVADVMSGFLLWYISKRPTYGYELIRDLRREHEFVRIGPAHIYPALSSMAQLGLIRVKEVARGKRIKKLYSVTPLGRKKLLEIKKTHFGDSLRARFLREMLS